MAALKRWGKGTSKDGGFLLMFDYKGVSYHVTAVRTGYRSPYVQMQFAPLRDRPPFDDERMRLELRQRLNAIPGVSIPVDGISKYPSFPLSALKDDFALEHFLRALEWMLRQVTRSESEGDSSEPPAAEAT